MVFLVAFTLLVGASALFADDIVVTNDNDDINGDVSSPSALRANPGSDGISLAEAVAAANNSNGPSRIVISDSLAGRTITPRHAIQLSRDGTTLTGPLMADGMPSVTLDGHLNNLTAFVYVLASNVTVSNLRFAGSVFDCVAVTAGRNPNENFPGQPRPRQSVRHVIIENNVFAETPKGSSVRIYMAPWAGSTDALSIDASIEDVLVLGNWFASDFGGLNVAANGFNCSISDSSSRRTRSSTATSGSNARVARGTG